MDGFYAEATKYYQGDMEGLLKMENKQYSKYFKHDKCLYKKT